MDFQNKSNSVVSIGVDMVDVLRIQKLHTKSGDAFLKRIYTEEEIQYCLKYKNPYPQLAARFAAKEAVSKALKTGIGAVDWKSIAVSNKPSGEPVILLDAKAQKILESLGGKTVLISLTHTDQIGQAFTVVVS